MKKLQILSFALILSLCLSVPAFAWTVDEVNWNEVDVTIQEPTSAPTNTPSGWAKSGVEAATVAGLVPALTGDPGFQDTITREQFAELVVCMAEKVQGGELDAAGSAFNDSSNPAVLKAYAAGIVAGVGENRFAPTAKSNDGLSGFVEAISAAFPHTEVQRCIIHQIRASTRYVSYKDVKAFSADLKPIYKAPTEEIALSALDEFEAKWGAKYPLGVKGWCANWNQLSTMYKYPPEIRKLIYTTKAIENFNRQL
jgi:hypothetical protein